MSDPLRPKLAPFNSELPVTRASTVPSEWYLDADIAHREREALFLDSWQAVGRADQIAEPGQYFTVDLVGEPLLIVRTQDGVRALANVCRHKGARVACQAEGTSRFFQCRYHGWTYNLEGVLKGTPEMDGAEGFRKESLSLPQYEVAVRGAFVWVHLGRPTLSIDEFLKPLTPYLDVMNLESFSFHSRKIYDMKCNWKGFVDNYLDGGYHVNTIHPALAGVLDYSQYVNELFDWATLQTSPLQPSKDPAVNSVRGGDSAYYWWFFPNFMVNAYDKAMDTNWVIPLTVDTCRVVIDFYFRDVDEAFANKSVEVAHQVQLEDVEICEDSYLGLCSRSYDTGRFSPKRESGAYLFHQRLAETLSL